MVTRTPPANPIQPEVTSLAGDEDTLLVAAYNVLNLDALEASADPAIPDRFDAIAAQIITNLNLPDIIALQEIQDNDGPGNAAASTVTAADVTLQNLIDAIVQAGGPTYQFIDNTFIGDDTSGGEGGGNIRTAFLYNPARVEFVPGSDRPVTDPVTQADGIPGNNPFEASRIPLAADFIFNGETLTVISVHNQAGGANDFDNDQPRFSGPTSDRNQESAEINGFIDEILAADPDANVIVTGDFNDFEFQPWTTFLDGTFDGGEAILLNLIDLLPELEQYSFQFTANEAGNHVILDHLFATPGLFANREGIDIVHVNAEFPNDVQASDHDPTLASFTLGAPVVVVVPPEPIESIESVVGTPESDSLEGGLDFDGILDLLFVGGGNDFVDASPVTATAGPGSRNRVYGGAGGDDLLAGTNDRLFGGSSADELNAANGTGGNRLFGGDGDDEITVGSGDRAFGGPGNDILEASLSEGGSRLYGGPGDDLFFLGAGDRVVGGEGNDRFFVGEGGGNLITGGTGADEFAIANGSIPMGVSTITDFEAGEDLIINGLGASFAEVTLTAQNGDTLVSIPQGDLAVLLGVNPDSLSAANFVFR
ncbi:MAG: hypothetical protein HC890_10205 [Chloroflexaceae bacterium]|nr:hypothetical protein [Chloroflexaceae bacterium]